VEIVHLSPVAIEISRLDGDGRFVFVVEMMKYACIDGNHKWKRLSIWERNNLEGVGFVGERLGQHCSCG